jgi:hypothetical protein
MAEGHHYARDVTRIERSAFNPAIGTRAALFALTPLVLAFIIHQPLLFFSTLAALFLVLTEGQPSLLPTRILLVACFTEALSLGLGTLTATAGPALSIPILGVAIFIALLGRGRPQWASVATFTAITFAVGLGLPGYSAPAAGERVIFALVGCLWALAGIELHRFIIFHWRHTTDRGGSLSLSQPMPRAETLRSSVVLAVACSVGFSIGFALGLPRDYWIVVTILLTVRPNISLTRTFTLEMAIGTVIGAMIGAAITLATSNFVVLTIFLFIFGLLMFSSRGVNLGLVQIFFAPFIIILLNILYPGEWYLAFYRILAVVIGVAISFVLVYILERLKKTSTWL